MDSPRNWLPLMLGAVTLLAGCSAISGNSPPPDSLPPPPVRLMEAPESPQTARRLSEALTAQEPSKQP